MSCIDTPLSQEVVKRMRSLTSVLIVFAALGSASGQTYTISTFAGGGLPVSIPGTSASLYGPSGVAVDKAGNIYFSDGTPGAAQILRLDAATGVLTLVAGNGTAGFSGDNGLATAAQLNNPKGIAVDATGNIYIADYGNKRVRKVSNGVITTVLDPDNEPDVNGAPFQPGSVAVDSFGNLYASGGAVVKLSKGIVTTIALAPDLYLTHNPGSIAVDSADNLYVIDEVRLDNGIYQVNKISNGVASLLNVTLTQQFGLGTRPLNLAGGIAVDTAGGIYIAYGSTILKFSGGVTSTVAGNGTPGFSGDGGPATAAQLALPGGLAVDSGGNLYITDVLNQRIRKISNGVIRTAAGGGSSLGDNGPAILAQLNLPTGLALDAADNLYISDGLNNRIRKISNGAVTTVAGIGAPGFSGDNGPASGAQLNLGSGGGITVDATGILYIADSLNGRIRKVQNGVITTVAGNGTPGFSGDGGPAASAQLSYPVSVAVDAAGNLYIADTNNFRIRKVSNGVITTIAGGGSSLGDNGPATSAALTPASVAVDSAGNLYVADIGFSRIREISNGVITTVAGNGTYGFSGDGGPATNAELFQPRAIAVDSEGNIFIGDQRIREVSHGAIATVAGNGTSGFSGDNGSAASAQLSFAAGLAVSAAGNIFVADFGNNRIRVLTPGTTPKITQNGVVPVYSSTPVIQPGSWVSIFGTTLANTTASWNGDFPTSLGGTSVTIDNKPAYLWFVSPTQINLQVPDDAATGTVSVAVTTASGTTAKTVTLAPQAPSFSLLGDGRHVAAEIATPNGKGAYGGGTYDLAGPSNTFSYSTRPAKAGETLTLFGVGFGPTNPAVPAGKVFTGRAPVSGTVTVAIGGVNAPVAFAGITQAGLYQINVTVPNAASGDQQVQATVNGVKSGAGPVVTVQ